MKTTLTIEQSATLIELGVDPKLASKCRVEHYADDETEYLVVPHDEYCYELASLNPQPLFALTDILAILPKEIETDDSDMVAHEMEINWYSTAKVWKCGYVGLSCPTNISIAPELIDALYQLLCWVIEQGYCNAKIE